IGDIFAGRGVTLSVHTEDNEDGAERTVEQMERTASGLIFTNLVDFDSKYGHRRDACGYAQALERFDLHLPRIIARVKPNELLILCADHGNDPTHAGFDHTREYIPLLVYGRDIPKACDVGTRSSFADIGATVAEALGVAPLPVGKSFLSLISDSRG
ncbi:MAG: phosphopentomutase, partial [Clostridiales Family XIII bacterium]|nr:phosphopentomutase [Clostridiales Family XIII bacterium]